MALGNAWHIPGSAEPRGFAGMRDPVGAIVPGAVLTVISGNQFRGAGDPGNQLQAGSAVCFRLASQPGWTSAPLSYLRTVGNNEYYSASVPSNALEPGDVVQYYLQIAYDDHETTFLHSQADVSARTGDEAVARAAPFSVTVADPGEKGRWGPVFGLPNVAIHTHVLPDGRVLMWGRRDGPADDLDVQECTPFVWDPVSGTTTSTPQPELADGRTVNLFCSGHAFLPDGRLLVVGGHRADGDGLGQAALFDWRTGVWTPTAPMATPSGEPVRRWYPTATTLPSGAVLVLSGSYADPALPAGAQVVVEDLLQVWEDGTWRTIDRGDGTPLDFVGLPLYPRMHVASDGRVLMSGTNDRTLLLETSPPGAWTEVGLRAAGARDYCPAVLYDEDKVIYIGGGNDQGDRRPTAQVEVIDLRAGPARWRHTAPMTYPRRQHNAVVLPDGTVLVIGGTRGGGGPDNGFNDLGPGQPVRTAELWDPGAERWTELTAESVDRCYHATAVLLPDATVLSAGGGEYRPDTVNPNDPDDSHRNAQVFSPPYLFTGGRRPAITSAPESVGHAETFDVGTAVPGGIARVSLIRLPSVTHSFDQDQRICFPAFRAEPDRLVVTAPAPNSCPPGHYMMFLVDGAGVPSVARTVRVGTPPGVAGDASAGDASAGVAELVDAQRSAPVPSGTRTYPRLAAHEAAASVARGTRVVVGVTGTCPYGIGACWGGAHEALGRLTGVALVHPVPNVADSTAEVHLGDEGLPDLGTWRREFGGIVNGTYELRGVEVTLRGDVALRDGQLLLVAPTGPLELLPLTQAEKVQWDRTRRSPRPLEEDEAAAFEQLLAAAQHPAEDHRVTVTGPLRQTGAGHVLHVRLLAR